MIVCAGAALPAQQQATASRVPLQQLAAAFSTRSLAAHQHAHAGGSAHFTKGSAAIAESRAPGHATVGASVTTVHSAVLDAFVPAERSALAANTHRQPHVPLSATPAGMSKAGMLRAEAQPTHASPTKAKP